MLQSTDPVSTINRFDKLPDLPEHVTNSDVSSPRSNRRTDSITNAANTRIKSQRYMFKQSKHHDHHHSIQQETLSNNMERIPVVINGHVDPPQRRLRRTFNCDSASSVQRRSDKSTTIKDVSKVVIFGDSHSWGLSAKLSSKLSNTYEVIGFTKPNCDMQTLLSIENQDIINFTKKDVLVLIMGMNDTYN
jgi:hypothetical protein